jgi:hypothetical protein
MGTVDDVLGSVETKREITCGGKIVNCIDGAIKSEPLLAKFTSGMVVHKATLNQAFEIPKILAETFGSYSSNRRYVNFRRDLASLEIEYGNSQKPLTGSYMSSFGDPLYQKTFDPELMLNYANNRRMDGSLLIDPLTDIPTMESNTYWAKPAAAEPYLGLVSRTAPYYTAYCMDNSYDIKARIKMVVRDWDRILPSSATSTYFERISDVDLLPPFARQDVPYTEEVTGDSDSWNEFNDREDWDDLIEMERDDSGVAYDPSITIWRPLPDGTYTNGFFNPAWFPYDVIN